MVTAIAMGEAIKEVKTITKKAVAEFLNGLPKEKMHCSNLGAEALAKTIEDYENKRRQPEK